jgi:hypothetical protein
MPYGGFARKDFTALLPYTMIPFSYRVKSAREEIQSMSHIIMYDPEERIIKANIQGKFTLGEASEFITEIIQIAKEHDCFLILSDYHEAELARIGDKTQSCFKIWTKQRNG